MARSFFDDVRDAFEGIMTAKGQPVHCTAHDRGIKVWFGEATREHYEAQLIRLGGEVSMEVGFHAEYPKADLSEAALAKYISAEPTWRAELGNEPVVGPFLGADRWRRISEIWPAPDPNDVDAAIETALRLVEYADALEPIRRQAT